MPIPNGLPFVISPVFLVSEGILLLVHHIHSKLCDGPLALLINPQQAGAWTSSALGTFKPDFQSNRPLSLNENCGMPTRQADPSGLSHVWWGRVSLATLSPTALTLPNSLKYCKSSTTLLSHEKSEVQRRGMCSGPYPISLGSQRQNQGGGSV